VDRAPEVDAHDPLPVGERHLADRPGDRDAGVVDQEIAAAEVGFGARAHLIDLERVRHVAAHRLDPLGAGALRESGRLFEAALVDVREQKARVPPSELERESPTKPTRSTRHHRPRLVRDHAFGVPR
jgi:hypothetical protein